MPTPVCVVINGAAQTLGLSVRAFTLTLKLVTELRDTKPCAKLLLLLLFGTSFLSLNKDLWVLYSWHFRTHFTTVLLVTEARNCTFYKSVSPVTDAYSFAGLNSYLNNISKCPKTSWSYTESSHCIMHFDRLVNVQTGAGLSPCGATVPHVCKPITSPQCCWGAESITGADPPPAAAIELDPDTVPTACPDPARPDDHFSILSLCTAVLDITTSLPNVLVVTRLWW